MSTTLPEKSFGDHLHLILRAGISAIPTLGGPALEFLNAVVAPPIERRRNDWFNELADKIYALERENRLKVEGLAENEEFISAVLQATTSALRNHQQEKLDALRNAVLNSALGKSPEGVKSEMFLAFVDQFTALHLRVLRVLQELSASDRLVAQNAVPNKVLSEVAMESVPGLRGHSALAQMLVEDLLRRGLILWTSPAIETYVKPGIRGASELGEEFLRFISDPQVVSGKQGA